MYLVYKINDMTQIALLFQVKTYQTLSIFIVIFQNPVNFEVTTVVISKICLDNNY